jgi:hypothetical protein
MPFFSRSVNANVETKSTGKAAEANPQNAASISVEAGAEER